MICPHCCKETTVPKKPQNNKEIYARFLEEWNDQGVIYHRKITTKRKKAIDKVLKDGDYTQEEIFKAFENYGIIVTSPDYFWNYRWVMEDFLNRGLHKFVDEAEPFTNNKKEVKPASNNPYMNFSCGGD